VKVDWDEQRKLETATRVGEEVMANAQGWPLF
jgi:hypothetical protein